MFAQLRRDTEENMPFGYFPALTLCLYFFRAKKERGKRLHLSCESDKNGNFHPLSSFDGVGELFNLLHTKNLLFHLIFSSFSLFIKVEEFIIFCSVFHSRTRGERHVAMRWNE